MIGMTIGLLFGATQTMLLFFAVRDIARHRIRTLPLMAQIFCPMTGLVLCGLTRPEDFLFCALSMVATLLVGGIVNYAIHIRREKT